MTEREKLPKLEVEPSDWYGDYHILRPFPHKLTREDALEVIRRAEAFEGLCEALDTIERLHLDLGMCYSEKIQSTIEAAIAKSEKK